MSKGLYGKTRFWDEKPLILNAIPQNSINPMVFPEGEFMRVFAEITGNLAACVGNLVITIKGKLYDVEVPLDTLTLTAVGLTTILKQKLVDIRGFDEIVATGVYTDAGVPVRGVITQVWIGIPNKKN